MGTNKHEIKPLLISSATQETLDIMHKLKLSIAEGFNISGVLGCEPRMTAYIPDATDYKRVESTVVETKQIEGECV